MSSFREIAGRIRLPRLIAGALICGKDRPEGATQGVASCAALGQKALNACHRRSHRSHSRPRVAGGRQYTHYAGRPRRSCRPQRLRQDHAVQRHRRRHLARARQRGTAAALAHWAAGAGSPERSGEPARGGAQGRRRAQRAVGRGRDRPRSPSHRRNPDPARRYGRARRPSAWCCFTRRA